MINIINCCQHMHIHSRESKTIGRDRTNIWMESRKHMEGIRIRNADFRISICIRIYLMHTDVHRHMDFPYAYGSAICIWPCVMAMANTYKYGWAGIRVRASHRIRKRITTMTGIKKTATKRKRMPFLPPTISGVLLEENRTINPGRNGSRLSRRDMTRLSLRWVMTLINPLHLLFLERRRNATDVKRQRRLTFRKSHLCPVMPRG